MSLQKRPHSRSSSPPSLPHYLVPSTTSASSSSSLTIQAHEASLISRRHEQLAARTEGKAGVVEGGRMIRWLGGKGEGVVDGEEVWVDRYDALNLLTSLPRHLPSTSRSRSPISASSEEDEDSRGFTDLESDSEEMFFFQPEERESIRRRKRRRLMEQGREERMALLAAEEADRAPVVEEDEGTEPSIQQLSLMHTLHRTLSSASDPKMLELRILANHGADPRFASFLRPGGKWKSVWEGIREGRIQEGQEKEEEEEQEKVSAGGGLVAYGSDSDEEDQPAPLPIPTPPTTKIDTPPPSFSSTIAAQDNGTEDNDEAAKHNREAKAEKVREWARKRKEQREREAEGLAGAGVGEGA